MDRCRYLNNQGKSEREVPLPLKAGLATLFPFVLPCRYGETVSKKELMGSVQRESLIQVEVRQAIRLRCERESA
jgi:hypothetical protein